MSSRSEMTTTQAKRIERLERRCKQLEAGAQALEITVLRYGNHTAGCEGEPCSCDWESTREIVESGRRPVVTL